jgi:GntR family transcriptional repressor for pyruvate dehydrogenase complex
MGILVGDLRPGERLAPMRALATEFGISLPSVREAVAQLRGEGLVEVRHGIGCFVVRRPRIARALKAATRRAARREVAELRVVVEPAVAGIAARRRTSAGVRDLLGATWEREAARRSGDPRTYVDADLDFHARVAAAARGPIGVAAHRLAGETLRPVMEANAAALAGDDRLAALHRMLADAVADGRPMRAVRAARAIVLIETQPPRPP